MGGRVLWNSALNLTGQGTHAVFHLLSIIILARTLGTTGFGQYYTIFALILVVQLVAEAGLATILTSRLVRSPEQRRQIVSEGETLSICVCVLSTAVLAALGIVVSWWQQTNVMLSAFLAAGVACAGIQVQRFCAGVLQASERFGFENVARVMQGVVFAACTIFFVANRPTTIPLVVALLAASHWTSALFMLLMLARRKELVLPASRVPWRSWLGEGGPLGFADVVRSLTWQLDTVLLGLLQPAAVVGIYSVAYRPLGPLNWIPRAVMAASFPSFTRLSAEREALEKAIAQSSRLLVIAAVPIAVTIFLLAEPFVLLVAGRDYIEAAVPLRFLIWITVLSFFSMQFRFLLAALGKQRTYAALVFGVFALEAVIELALIPRWSYFGALTGSMVGEFVFAVAGWVVCRGALQRRDVQPALATVP